VKFDGKILLPILFPLLIHNLNFLSNFLVVYRISVVAFILHIFYAGTQTAWFQDQLQTELCNQNTSNISGTDGIHCRANIKYINS